MSLIFHQCYLEYLSTRPKTHAGFTSLIFGHGVGNDYIKFCGPGTEYWTVQESYDKVVIRYSGKLVPGPGGYTRVSLQEAIDFIYDKTHNVKEFTGDISFEI